MDMTKFDDEDDPGFAAVTGELRRWVKYITTPGSSGFAHVLNQKIDLAKLPIAKEASFNSHIEGHNARCLANTRVELQRHITEWAKDGSGKPLFWPNGMADTGKSTIARTTEESNLDYQCLQGTSFITHF